MHLLQDSEIKIESWKHLLMGSSFANPFQTHEFYTFFNSVHNYSASVFAVSEKDDLLSLCVVTFQKQQGITGYFSRRAIIYGGPLLTASENGIAALDKLLKGINERVCQKVIYSETYNFFDYSIFKETFAKNGWEYENHLNVQIIIENKSLKEVLASMKYNRRREVSLSFKEGAIIKEADKIEEIRDLFNILVDLYNDRVRLPLPSFTFFKQLFLSKTGKVFIVIHNEKVIGGSFCLYLPSSTIYTYYYCGLREHQKNIFPSHLAIYAVIEFAVKNQFKIIDLMGAGKPEKEYGVRDFKLRFGGILLEQGRFLKIYNSLLFRFGKAGLNFIKFAKK